MNSMQTLTDGLVVYLIDDDEAVLSSQVELLSATGLDVEPYPSAEAFLSVLTPLSAGCVVTDLQLGGMSGLELQRRLAASNSPLPIIVVSGQADVTSAVEFMENGAVTLLQKPYAAHHLLHAVHKALDRFLSHYDRYETVRSIQARQNSLTNGEMSVLKLMIEGCPNKIISVELAISMRTVDRRRSLVLEKMQVGSAPELARLVTLLEASAPETSVAEVPAMTP